ncbi:hypothetical protein HMPREF1544_07172 [Mucor circinelloides 1006PhL]|uniref:DDHD domain-containing protein n=1 Tax=Mucor circinelloides f. circinelloides (strain 1006PhL) TaxID=1220926 RepID=S2J8P9_MUCC1|nr:hypothetical protein HMPREF1544_07172 [Mucor circinelloides 1006PhL]
MFFEATYVPSPPLSVASEEDNTNSQTDNQSADSVNTSEPSSDKPVDHLIFVIHGIGQQTEQYGHFYEHIENLQETTRQVLQAKVPDHNVRIELIPIEWHRHIHEQVDPTINKITLKSIPTIRLIENDYLADVLFYFSKDRGQKIIDNVTNLFNTSYHNFIEKHPNFSGKIAIMGYSLGGIIVWDILSHQREPQENEAAMYDKMDIKFTKLDFKPNYFFGLGSPVGAVLTFRGQDPKLYHPDFDIQFENVFHPFDPLGYRFEPLFNDYFTDKPAVLVQRSVPIGPSFSFPSMPSFPLSAGFLSFFSWKQEDKVAKTIYNATAEAADANEDTIKDENAQVKQQETSSGFMSSFLQYFSRGGGTEKMNDTENKQDASKNGIITWDPLKEQTREQLLALRDDLDRTLNGFNASSSGLPRRPAMNIRSRTIGPSTPQEDSLYSSSLEQNSDGSVFDKASGEAAVPSSINKSRSSFSIENKKPERIALRKTLTEHNPKRQHLVEVLGIDGVRVDSFERARVNFDKHVQQDDHKDTSQSTDHLQQSTSTTTDKTKDGKADDTKSDDLWSDLNKEMNKPGPAITSPGESRAEVAQDATVPASSTDKDEAEGQEADNAIKEEQEAISTLPGKNRMDYVLQPDSVMSMIANEYLIGLRAHFSYWTNKDFIWHMLRRIEDLDNNNVASSSSSTTTTNTKKKEQQQQQDSSRKLYHAEASNGRGAANNNKPTTSIVSIDDSNIPKKKK